MEECRLASSSVYRCRAIVQRVLGLKPPRDMGTGELGLMVWRMKSRLLVARGD
jgi:hypothetical protein